MSYKDSSRAITALKNFKIMVMFTNWTGVCICVKPVFTYLCKINVPWITKGLTFIHLIFWRKDTVHPSEMFKAHSLNDVWGANDVSFCQYNSCTFDYSSKP